VDRLEQEVLCETKLKPLLQREQIVIDQANYKEIVRKARREYQLDLQLGESPLLKNEFGVKPLNHKRVAQDLGEIPKRPGQMLFRGPQNNFFTKQALHCLELASCNGTVIHSSFSIDVEIECAQMFFGKKVYSVSFPVNFYTCSKDVKASIISQNSIRDANTYAYKTLKVRELFPKAFDPLQMPGAHFHIEDAD